MIYDKEGTRAIIALSHSTSATFIVGKTIGKYKIKHIEVSDNNNIYVVDTNDNTIAAYYNASAEILCVNV